MSFSILSLRRFIEAVGEAEAKSFLSTFVAFREHDAESYLKEKSIEFESAGISGTYLALKEN
ncbi:MAG: hypothetical protein LBJ20_07490 [Candidatus Methanoplasma sp.]|jgi:hypothetical protein|nr:hypothetical protein [Candidatus Methanoplasma sp.]